MLRIAIVFLLYSVVYLFLIMVSATWLAVPVACLAFTIMFLLLNNENRKVNRRLLELKWPKSSSSNELAKKMRALERKHLRKSFYIGIIGFIAFFTLFTLYFRNHIEQKKFWRENRDQTQLKNNY